MLGILRRLDQYSLLTAFSTLALQYQFFRLSGFPLSEGMAVTDFYAFVTILMFFSMVWVYNIDHFWDRGFPLTHPAATRYILVDLLCVIGILLGLGLGWDLWDPPFLGVGIGVAALCGIHLLIFHSRLEKNLFMFKELSVAGITVIGIASPLIYLDFFQGQGLLNGVKIGSLFLVVINSVLFYSFTRLQDDRDWGIGSLFHHLSFSSARRFLLSLNFFSLITLLIVLRAGVLFSPADSVQGAIWYFPTVVAVQGLLVKKVHDLSPTSLSHYRLLSESIFLFLLPFFLW